MSNMIRINPTETHGSAQYTIGGRGEDHLGREYIYLQAGGATGLGAACIISSKGTMASEMTTANSDAHAVCVGMVAHVDDNYGWYQVYGLAEIETAAVADEAQLYTSSAGRLDDASTSTNIVNGCHAEESQSTVGGLTECWISYPFTIA